MKSRTVSFGAGALMLGSIAALASACGGSDEGSELDPSNGGRGGSANGSGGTFILDPNGQAGEDGRMPVGGNDCGFTKLTASSPDVNVLLVVDKSLSMADTPRGFSSNKWEALGGALGSVFEQTADKIAYGLDLYPYSGTSGAALDDACQMPSDEAISVPVQAGADAAPLILAALDENGPSGGTPTAAALGRAFDYFTNGAGQSLGGERYVLLATDGGPNCSADANISCEAATCTDNMDGKNCGGNCCDADLDPDGPSKCLDDAATIDAVAALAGEGIKTFVVGIPGTEAYTDTLDALAAESGVDNPDGPPAYFAVSADGDAEGLASVLSRITTGLVKTCVLQLEEEPPSIDDVFVVIDGVLIEKDDPDGWAESDPATSPPTIEIQGETCAELQAQGAEYINVSYGCPNFEPR